MSTPRQAKIPGKFFVSVGIFAHQGKWEFHRAKAIDQIARMLLMHKCNLSFQRLHNAGGQDCLAVFFTFALAHDGLGLFKVYVFGVQAQVFHQAQAAAVQHVSHELLLPLHPAQHLADFILGEQGRQVLTAFGAQRMDRASSSTCSTLRYRKSRALKA